MGNCVGISNNYIWTSNYTTDPNTIHAREDFFIRQDSFCTTYIKTPEDIKNAVFSSGDLQDYANNQFALYLISPPAMKYVPVRNFTTMYKHMTKLKRDQYTYIANPFYPQALIAQSILEGTVSGNGFPCIPSLLVPIGQNYEVGGTGYTKYNNPAYNDCTEAMLTELEKRQVSFGQSVCVGDPALPYLQNTKNFDTNWIKKAWKPGDNVASPPTYTVLLQQCIENKPGACELLFTNPPGQLGPYDTVTKKPCTNNTDKTCTYYLCEQGKTTNNYVCSAGGICTSSPITGPGTFKTLQDCIDCQANNNCGGINVCCPESQLTNKNPMPCKTAPQQKCNTSSECTANPKETVCEGGECVQCTASNTAGCSISETCVNNVCVKAGTGRDYLLYGLIGSGIIVLFVFLGVLFSRNKSGDAKHS